MTLPPPASPEPLIDDTGTTDPDLSEGVRGAVLHGSNQHHTEHQLAA